MINDTFWCPDLQRDVRIFYSDERRDIDEYNDYDIVVNPISRTAQIKDPITHDWFPLKDVRIETFGINEQEAQVRIIGESMIERIERTRDRSRTRTNYSNYSDSTPKPYSWDEYVKYYVNSWLASYDKQNHTLDERTKSDLNYWLESYKEQVRKGQKINAVKDETPEFKAEVTTEEWNILMDV